MRGGHSQANPRDTRTCRSRNVWTGFASNPDRQIMTGECRTSRRYSVAERTTVMMGWKSRNRSLHRFVDMRGKAGATDATALTLAGSGEERLAAIRV
jgi:hypothetical protein